MHPQPQQPCDGNMPRGRAGMSRGQSNNPFSKFRGWTLHLDIPQSEMRYLGPHCIDVPPTPVNENCWGSLCVVWEQSSSYPRGSTTRWLLHGVSLPSFPCGQGTNWKTGVNSKKTRHILGRGHVRKEEDYLNLSRSCKRWNEQLQYNFSSSFQ